MAGRRADRYVLGPWKFARGHGQWYRPVLGTRWWNRGVTVSVIYGPKIYPSQEAK